MKKFRRLLTDDLKWADGDAPDKAWANDITYIRTPEGFEYLAVVIDLYSRRLIGW